MSEEENKTENTTTEVIDMPTPEANAETPAKEESKQEAPKTEEKKESAVPRKKRISRGGFRREAAPKEFEESIVQIDRVTRVTAGGRQLRFRILVVIGDKKGRVGFGIAKSSEVINAVQKAISRAKKSLITIPIQNDTIPHEINLRYKASRVILIPAPEGKGIIAGGAVRKILELSGIKNILSKVHGSRNKINIVRLMMMALTQLQKDDKTPTTKIAEPPKSEPQEAVKPKEKEVAAKKSVKKSTTQKTPSKK